MEIYKKLEEKFAKFKGKKYACSVNSGTSALHLSLLALGIGKGDEVIVPDFTFIATALSVLYTGAKPVFVDCDDTLCINPKLIESKITKKTKAIIPVHIYSRTCDMENIMDIAKRHNLKVIEDCAEHHAVKLSKSDTACFSFQSSKQIHAEEGGMILTNNKKIYEEVNKLKTFYNDGKYFHKKIAFNYRMPNTQAKLALESMKKFKGKDWVKVFIFKSQAERDRELKKGGRVFFKPISSMPMFNKSVGKKALYYSKIGLVRKICFLQ